jgi:hypothetical protein
MTVGVLVVGRVTAADDRVQAAADRRQASHSALVQETAQREAAVAARHAQALKEKQAIAARAGA